MSVNESTWCLQHVQITLCPSCTVSFWLAIPTRSGCHGFSAQRLPAVLSLFGILISHTLTPLLGQTSEYKTHASCDKCCTSDVHLWLQELASRTYHAGDVTDVYVLSEGDTSSDQSHEENEGDESVVSDWSTEDGEIQRMVAATMYEFSGAHSL
jgi:hypothetical protein